MNGSVLLSVRVQSVRTTMGGCVEGPMAGTTARGFESEFVTSVESQDDANEIFVSSSETTGDGEALFVSASVNWYVCALSVRERIEYPSSGVLASYDAS